MSRPPANLSKKRSRRSKQQPSLSLGSLVAELSKQDKTDDVLESASEKPSEDEAAFEHENDFVIPRRLHYSRVLAVETTKDDKEGFKSCRWSPDGTCLLTCKDRLVKLYEVKPEAARLEEVVTAREGEPVYDYTWYPLMDSNVPATCCFASLSRSSPIHLWDAYRSNELRASYTLRSAGGEPVWGLSVGLTSSQVFCGLDSSIYVWDIERPGEPLKRKQTSNGDKGLSGIVSCFAFTNNSNNFAIGSYSGQVAVYSPQSNNRCIFEAKAQGGGVTQVKYSTCGRFLWAGARRSTELFCWDVRAGGQTVLHKVPRICRDNQRIEFELIQEDSIVCSGSSEHGKVDFWRTTGGEVTLLDSLVSCAQTEDDTSPTRVNGISVNTWNGNLAISKGQRVLPEINCASSSDEEDGNVLERREDGGISVYENDPE